MKNLNLTFVAEIGQNHNGNIDLCYELIKEAICRSRYREISIRMESKKR